MTRTLTKTILCPDWCTVAEHDFSEHDYFHKGVVTATVSFPGDGIDETLELDVYPYASTEPGEHGNLDGPVVAIESKDVPPIYLTATQARQLAAGLLAGAEILDSATA